MQPSSVIDTFHFEHYFDRFSVFVEEESGTAFTSFDGSPYTSEQEGYKHAIYARGREELNFGAWSRTDIGTGGILSAVIAAVELPDNNLVPWQARFGDESRPHHQLCVALRDGSGREELEAILFDIYRGVNAPSDAFTGLVSIIGKKYSLMAYLFFLKDCSRFMPIATSFFDAAFELLGADVRTRKQCSWDNYLVYNGVLADLQERLQQKLDVTVTLLDAHSFAWILVSQMGLKSVDERVERYKDLPEKDRDAVVKARNGQGRFREQLLAYWGSCAVTGCTARDLLRASHIKPWRICTVAEALDPHNGILLTPNLDAAFDRGYASFADDGRILLSPQLDRGDRDALGVHAGQRAVQVAEGHHPYLAYHRATIFRGEPAPIDEAVEAGRSVSACRSGKADPMDSELL